MKGKSLIVIACLAALNLAWLPAFSQTDDSAPDILASITKLYGSSTSSILLFGQTAAIGDIVKANLDYGDGTSTVPFRDPLPNHTFCWSGGCRNNNKSVISRLGISTGTGHDVLLIVDIAGATGFQPGSKGYIHIINPEWHIVGVVAGDTHLNTDFAGFGVHIDKEKGIVEWEGRGGCTNCGCAENGLNFVLLLQKGGQEQHKVSCSDLKGVEWALTAFWTTDQLLARLYGEGADAWKAKSYSAAITTYERVIDLNEQEVTAAQEVIDSLRQSGFTSLAQVVSTALQSFTSAPYKQHAAVWVEALKSLSTGDTARANSLVAYGNTLFSQRNAALGVLFNAMNSVEQQMMQLCPSFRIPNWMH